MKKLHLILLMALCLAGCKKEKKPAPAPVQDSVAPVITLNGNKNDTIFLQKAYNDPGATATDDKDGNISANVVITGSVNNNLTGNYIKIYTVKDAAGNAATQTRTITVRNGIDFLAGDFTVTSTYKSKSGLFWYTDSVRYYSAHIVPSSVKDSVFTSTFVNTSTPIAGSAGTSETYTMNTYGASEIFTVSVHLSTDKKSFEILNDLRESTYSYNTDYVYMR